LQSTCKAFPELEKIPVSFRRNRYGWKCSKKSSTYRSIIGKRRRIGRSPSASTRSAEKKKVKEEPTNGDEATNIKPSTAKKQRKKQKDDNKDKDKEKEKEKEDSKEKEEVKKPKAQMAPTEDLLGGDFNFTSNNQTDLASDDWLNGFVVDDKQFQNGGRGDDGGQFGFGASDEQNIDEETEKEKTKEKESDNSDAWLTQVTQMDDPLQGVEKPQKKVNKKGKTMAQMQTKNDLAGTFDDGFLNTINSGLSTQSTSKQTTQQVNNDPLFNNTNNSGFSTNSTSTFTTGNDPFRGLGGQTTTYNNNPNGPIPATYQKSEKNDPFSSLSWK